MENNSQVKLDMGLGAEESTPRVEPNLVDNDHEEKRVEEQEQEEPKHEEKQEKEDDGLDSELEVKLPSPCESKIDHSNDDDKKEQERQQQQEDGFKTPTSEEHKIPELLECPPPPRRQRAYFPPSVGFVDRRRLLDLELSSEIRAFLSSTLHTMEATHLMIEDPPTTPDSVGENKKVVKGCDTSDSDN